MLGAVLSMLSASRGRITNIAGSYATNIYINVLAKYGHNLTEDGSWIAPAAFADQWEVFLHRTGGASITGSAQDTWLGFSVLSEHRWATSTIATANIYFRDTRNPASSIGPFAITINNTG